MIPSAVGRRTARELTFTESFMWASSGSGLPFAETSRISARPAGLNVSGTVIDNVASIAVIIAPTTVGSIGDVSPSRLRPGDLDVLFGVDGCRALSRASGDCEVVPRLVSVRAAGGRKLYLSCTALVDEVQQPWHAAPSCTLCHNDLENCCPVCDRRGDCVCGARRGVPASQFSKRPEQAGTLATPPPTQPDLMVLRTSHSTRITAGRPAEEISAAWLA